MGEAAVRRFRARARVGSGTARAPIRNRFMRTIAHISDLHFGAHEPAVVAHLHAALVAIRPDLIVVSGDLTQRAHRSQFAEAAGFLARLEADGFMLLVVPGNHDVPMHKPMARLFWPLRRYGRIIARGRSRWYADQEIAVLGLASAHGLTVKDGRLTRIQIRSIADSFAGAPTGASRILVTHHPLVSLPGDEPGEIEPALRGARACAQGGRGRRRASRARRPSSSAQRRDRRAGQWADGLDRPSRDDRAGGYRDQLPPARHPPNSFNLIRLDGTRATIEEWIANGGAFSSRESGSSSYVRSAGGNGGWVAATPSA